MYNEIIFVSVDNVHNYLIRMKHPTHCPSLPRQIYSNCSLQVEIDDLLLYKSIYFEDVISVAFYDLSEYTSLLRFISKSNKKDSCCKNLKPLQHSHTNLFLICHKIPNSYSVVVFVRLQLLPRLFGAAWTLEVSTRFWYKVQI